MQKLIGYSRVSTRQQSADRQDDILAAGVRRDDLYVDHGVSGARVARPEFDRALNALIEGDTLVITTLDRLGRSTQNMLGLADELRTRGAGLRVLNLGGGDVDTATPMGAMVLTIRAALAQMEHEIKPDQALSEIGLGERILDSISKRRAAGKSLGGRPQRITDSQIRNAIRLVIAASPSRRWHEIWECLEPPTTAESRMQALRVPGSRELSRRLPRTASRPGAEQKKNAMHAGTLSGNSRNPCIGCHRVSTWLHGSRTPKASRSRNSARHRGCRYTRREGRDSHGRHRNGVRPRASFARAEDGR
ncbi:Resolvase domain protein (modular protein) [Microbacterium sp. C448]|nr:Resolvase domain protein (modular protein) [Microbacterium sp. C448]